MITREVKQKPRLKSIELNLTESVKIYYGINIKKEFCSILNSYFFDKVYIICDSDIYERHGSAFAEEMCFQGISYTEIKTKACEKNKCFNNLQYLCNKLVELKITKDSIVIAFGGGMLCNLVGLASSIIFRGLKYIEIPTTFMAQTDGSISNKQAVNGEFGKNQFGTYYAPLFIWADISYTMTEDIRYTRAGLVEGIKNCLIHDINSLGYFKSIIHKDSFSVNELLTLFEVIVKSKNSILKEDPTEEGYSIILEYGHTIGHSIEFLTDGELIHGEAVALGMCIIAECSFGMKLINEKERTLHYELLLQWINEKSIDMFLNLATDKIIKTIDEDNKRCSGGIKYIILEKIGKCLKENGDVKISVDQAEIIASINKVKSLLKKKKHTSLGQ